MKMCRILLKCLAYIKCSVNVSYLLYYYYVLLLLYIVALLYITSITLYYSIYNILLFIISSVSIVHDPGYLSLATSFLALFPPTLWETQANRYTCMNVKWGCCSNRKQKVDQEMNLVESFGKVKICIMLSTLLSIHKTAVIYVCP